MAIHRPRVVETVQTIRSHGSQSVVPRLAPSVVTHGPGTPPPIGLSARIAGPNPTESEEHIESSIGAPLAENGATSFWGCFEKGKQSEGRKKSPKLNPEGYSPVFRLRPGGHR
jgi:hypothetical protein